MKMISVLFGVILVGVGCTAAPKDWTYHYEAEKGDRSVTILFSPQPIESFTQRLPASSPDPLDSTATIEHATTRQLGSFNGHQIVEISLQLRETYYTDLFIILCQTSGDRYLPIYVQQYHRGTRTPTIRDFTIEPGGATFEVALSYSGSDPTSTVDQIVVRESASSSISVTSTRSP
jgi:hypothetical protein